MAETCPNESAESAAALPTVADWDLAENVTFLNHGSFGPSPRVVCEAQNEWRARINRQPMQFFVRDLQDAIEKSAAALADFVGADASDIAFVDNATFGMNAVALTVPLSPGDQILFSDHEYGAVHRIWQHAARKAGAEIVVQKLPCPLTTAEDVTETLLSAVTDKTRLIVVSHVTSPTAVILPVQQICDRAREKGIPVCIDGPHATGMEHINLKRLGCDFYVSSCHKWLSAPFGTGFLYVAKRWQQRVQPTIISWGDTSAWRPDKTPAAARWQGDFHWAGTRDPSGWLALPVAINFLQHAGFDRFRQYGHELARYARERIAALTGLEQIVPDSPEWYGVMYSAPLPPSTEEKVAHRDPLQDRLFERYRIEVPISERLGRRRSLFYCHWYNNHGPADRLVEALAEEPGT